MPFASHFDHALGYRRQEPTKNHERTGSELSVGSGAELAHGGNSCDQPCMAVRNRLCLGGGDRELCWFSVAVAESKDTSYKLLMARATKVVEVSLFVIVAHLLLGNDLC